MNYRNISYVVIVLLSIKNIGCSGVNGGVDNVLGETRVSSVVDVSTPSVDDMNPVIDVSTPVYMIDSGAEVSFVDSMGNVWQADFGSEGGFINDRGNVLITNSDVDEIYETERYCLDNYKLPVNNGVYRVVLHFAETYHLITQAGQREFHVTVEEQELKNFDIFKEAGGQNIAVDKEFVVTVNDGFIDINFFGVIQCPTIQGLEVWPDELPSSN